MDDGTLELDCWRQDGSECKISEPSQGRRLQQDRVNEFGNAHGVAPAGESSGAGSVPDSISFDGGAFAVFDAAVGGGFFAEGRDAQIPDFFVDGFEVAFRERKWGGKFLPEGMDVFQSAINLGGGAIRDGIYNAGSQLDAVAEHEEIISGGESKAHGFLESVMIENGAHIKVVRHDEALESKFAAEKIEIEGGRERGRTVRGVNRREGDMADHHAVEIGDKGAEDGELASVEVGAGAGEAGEFFVWVESGVGVARKMFAATEDAPGTERGVEETGFMDNFRDGTSVAASLERIVGKVIKADVQNGAEVEIEAEEAEELGGEFPVPGDEGGVVAVAELAGIWGFLADEAQAADPSAFLVNRQNGFVVAEVAQIIQEATQLGGRLDVASEDNEATRLQRAIERGGGGIEDGAGNPNEEKLTTGRR